MTGPFKGLGDAALGMQQTTAQQNQQRVDNQRQQDALKIEQDRLKLIQDEARNNRIDKLANGLNSSFTFLANNSKYLDPDEVAAIGTMQTEWKDAENSFYLNGDDSKMKAFGAKYPGAAISVPVGSESRVLSLVDLANKIQKNKPRVDLEEQITADVGAGLGNLFSQAMADPTITDADKNALRAVFTGPGTPFEKGQTASSLLASVTPTRTLLSLRAKGAPTTGAQMLALKGMVDGFLSNPAYKDDPDLVKLQAYYDPSKAPPEMQGIAANGKALMDAATAASLSSTKLPTVQYRRELAGAASAEMDLKLQEDTFPSVRDAAIAVNSLKVTDAKYNAARIGFAQSLLPLENERDKIGVLANIAALPEIGVAGLQRMSEDSTLMAAAGITPSMIQSAITRAGQTTRATGAAERAAIARDTSALTQYGYAGIAELQAALKKGDIDEVTANALMDYAEAVDNAARVGINVQTLTGENEVTRQRVIGESIADLTQMGINVQKITFKNGYQGQAYELIKTNEGIRIGAPGAEAQMSLAEFQQRTGASQNAIIVQDGARQYLLPLTQKQYQTMLQDADNGLVKSQVDGLYVFERAQVENKLAIAAGNAGVQQNINLLTTATAVAQYVGPEAVSAILANTAGNEAKRVEAQNLLTQLNAAAPYMGKLGAQTAIAQVTTQRATIAQMNEQLTRANLILPYLPKVIAQQVAAEVAQGRLTAATATAALKNVDFNQLGTGLDTVAAIAAMGTWEDALKLPQFKAWAQQNGVTKPLFDSMKAYQTQQETKAASGKSPQQQAYENLDKEELRARQEVETARADPQYKKDVDFLAALKDPKVDVNAMMQEGFATSAILSNYDDFSPQAKAAADRIIAYNKKFIDPAKTRYNNAVAAKQQWMKNNQGFNPTQGSSDSTPAVYSAPADLKSNIEGAAAMAGVPADVFYGFIGAESTFKPNPGNYKGLDYVGYGQVGAEAAADVNAMLKKKGAPTLNRNDPQDNLQISAYYLKMMMDKYPDPAMAYAAYNMGAGNFNAFLKKNGGKFDVTKLPKETQTGIANMKRYMGEFKNGVPSQNVQLPPSGRIPSPGQQGGVSPAPGRAQEMKPGTDLTKLGITSSAIYNTVAADGSPISFCTRFAREYTENANGMSNRSMSGTWFLGTATETLSNFASKGALFATDMPVSSAKARTGGLKQGDLIFLKYGNPALDHVAVYDGKGGVIQHSLPSFRGTTIQGAVNSMSLTDFFAKAGKATVSFGRVPAQGKAAPAAQPKPAAPAPQTVKTPPAGKPAGTGATPAKPAAPTPTKWDVKLAPKPAFAFPDLTIEDAKLLSDQAQKVRVSAGQSNYQMNLRGLNMIGEQLVAAGYDAALVRRYVQQLRDMK